MKHITFLLGFIFWLALTACTPPQLPERHFRGGWLTKNDKGLILSQVTKQTLQTMKSLGIKWIALGPDVHMENIHKPALSYGSDDNAYKEFITYATQQGFQITLLPRIESPDFFKPPYPFRADIEMDNEEDWKTFHDNYKQMIGHYARLSQETGVGMLILGLEYQQSVSQFPESWRAIIKHARSLYKGKLTYSANWYEEFQQVTFWDELDYIGIGAYFELSDGPNTSMLSIMDNWLPIVKTLQKTSEAYNKPVIFTEVGYTTFEDAAQYPWKWQDDLQRPISQEQQADCYRALFRVFANEPWFDGFFIWRFYTDPSILPTYSYSPVNKPAGDVIQRWFMMP